VRDFVNEGLNSRRKHTVNKERKQQQKKREKEIREIAGEESGFQYAWLDRKGIKAMNLYTELSCLTIFSHILSHIITVCLRMVCGRRLLCPILCVLLWGAVSGRDPRWSILRTRGRGMLLSSRILCT
jgi:hypothetical protein